MISALYTLPLPLEFALPGPTPAILLGLCSYNATPETPLYSYHHDRWQGITTTALTQQLRQTVTVLGHTVGIHPNDISIRSLRASGAMALLCAHVDTDRIRLLGRWYSDKMLRYLHVQAYPVVLI